MIAQADPETSNLQPLSPGRKLAGCFILTEQIAENIWLAEDEALGKQVSLYVLPDPVFLDQRAMEEVRQEVRRSRQLIHPNVVRVYDFVEEEDFAAVAMDKVEGESLAAILRAKGTLSPDEINPWIAQLAETMSNAHRVQIFHRDLAPSNLFARPNGSLMITNFGISRAILDSMERAGIANGEIAHVAMMSPQQIDGERATESDDIYGIGALMFELLSGAPPFIGKDLVPQIRRSPAPPLNEARVAAGGSEIPASLEYLVAACLAKNPEQRPRSCSEIIAAFSQTSVAKAPPAKAPEPAPKAAPAQPAPAPEPDAAPVAPATSKQPADDSGVPQLPPPPPPPNAAKKNQKKPVLAPNFPDMDRPNSKVPLIGLAVAAALLAGTIYFFQTGDTKDKSTSGNSGVEALTTDPNSNALPAPGSLQSSETPDAGTPPTGNPETEPNQPAANAGPSEGPNAAAPGENPPKPPKPKPALIGAEPPPSKPASKPETPTKPEATPEPPKEASKTAIAGVVPVPTAPKVPAKLTIPEKASTADIAQLVAARQAAMEAVKSTSAAAAAAQQENARLREARQADINKQRAAFDQRKKEIVPVIIETTSVESDLAKLEDAMKKADAAAVEAAKTAEAARKAHEEFAATSGEKVAARKKAEDELKLGNQLLSEATKQADEIGQAASASESLRQQMALAATQLEKDLATLKTASDKAAAAEAKAMREANREKIAAVDQKIKEIETRIAKHKTARQSLVDLNDPTLAGAVKAVDDKITAAAAEISALQDEKKQLSSGAPPKPAPAAPKPDNAAAPEKGTDATASAAAPAGESGDNRSSEPPPATPAKRTNNSLGMTFVPVGSVEFATQLVTRDNYANFSKAVSLKPEYWRKAGFAQAPDHPVVNVSWKEATAFCKWLTDTEHKSGQLKSDEEYRLPTDLEWSAAVGLPPESGATPADRDMGVPDVYPWGNQWPPPQGAGNYYGEETGASMPIEGYNDKFVNTSPVGAFKPNAVGLHDMGGNVYQWVQDLHDSAPARRTLRGASWSNGTIKVSLLSSSRIPSDENQINDCYGFRVVRAKTK